MHTSQSSAEELTFLAELSAKAYFKFHVMLADTLHSVNDYGTDINIFIFVRAIFTFLRSLWPRLKLSLDTIQDFRWCDLQYSLLLIPSSSTGDSKHLK